MNKDHGTQQFHKLADPVSDILVDEYGPYVNIPLSMVRGGAAKPFPVHTQPMKHIINTSAPNPRGWYKPREPASDRIRPRPCYAEALLTTPYGGFCPVNCLPCYVNNGTRGYRATGLPTVNPEYPEHMRKQVAKLNISGAAYITSFTEPFHVLEDTYHITERLSKVFVDEGLPIFYLSRRIPPDWAIDVLSENSYSYMQWSVNTADAMHYRKISPGSFSLDQLYDTIRWVSAEDIYISIQCNPIIPGVSRLSDVLELIGTLAEAGANHMIFKFIEQVSNNRKVIVDRIRSRFSDSKSAEFDHLFSQVLGGVYTIAESVRIEWLDAILERTRANGMTMSLCYEYFDDGAAGSSLGPYYTTADQCHGRGVPVYYRPEPGAPFEPIAGCYKKGCLYCKERGTYACNSELLLEAKALAYKDLRTVISPTGNWDQFDSCARPEDAWKATKGNLGLKTDAELWGWKWD